MLDLIFPRVLGRAGYALRILPLTVLFYLGLLHLAEQKPRSTEALLPAALLVLGGLYAAFFLYLPRLRDCGMPFWTLSLAFIPHINTLLGILLLFRRGQIPLSGSNHEPPAVMPRPVIAGSRCSICGKGLVMAGDGRITDGNLVSCNDCAETR